ncbi:hypothetical protein BTM25_42650 [Actinomadura rubteroloni]|uniref:Uncharacterized protein n=1 Tax=Actinomadura rubteroloni TaxID=1926885 RepID=A0A2P4UKN7_9ACTN|nr:hypothetical protein [Actinomadura rubteroloni]POM25617.1 hypothetical protein BTM25_42650 [Actinomadura rubteroloni]
MITVEHVERLLHAEDPEAALIVVDGSPEVVSSAHATDGLFVTDRQDVVTQIGDGDPAPDTLRRLAEALDTAVTGLGG